MDDRFNTAAGWFLFAGIVGLGLSALSTRYYHGNSPERPEAGGYPVEVADDTKVEKGPPLAEFLAEADATQGASQAQGRCGTCHSFDPGGANGQGPAIHGIMGKSIGGNAAGFNYSSAMMEKGGTWGWDEMNEWLASPRKFVPGTTMSFAGISSPEERANILLYMNSLGSNLPLPEVPAEEPAEEAVDAATAPVEGEPVEAAGATSADEPVPSN